MTRELESTVGWTVWSPLERQLANLLLREVGSASISLWLSVALLTRASRQGDVCVDLERLAERRLSEVLAETSRDAESAIEQDLVLPNLADWLQLLRGSGLVGDDDARHPLTLKGHRLYLTRYRQHEAAVATRLVERLAAATDAPDVERLRSGLEHWFASTSGSSKQAAAIAATRRLCLITGGPGTGKTSTVVRLLGLLSDLLPRSGGRPLRVLLLAPTGKAAARLSESIVQSRERLGGLSAGPWELPTHATTVHSAIARCQRLPDGRRMPLRADLVVLDEASMVDLALMRRLLDAAVNIERLVVLGDPYQLASVEAGAVLGELCAAGLPGYAPEIATSVESASGVPTAVRSSDRITVADHRVELTENYRFRGDGGIGLLAQSIKLGDASRALELLTGHDAELRFLEPSEYGLGRIEEVIIRGNARLMAASSPEEALGRLGEFRVLCAHRKGRFGVETWNERLRRHFQQHERHASRRSDVEPILVTENAPDAVLHNGDLGIVWRVPKRVRAWFSLPAGKAAEFGLSRLPRHEPAYVMSVHKSQGSEVDEVVVLLPDLGSALLTRELLYTAVTRARKRCTLVGTRATIEQAIRCRIERNGGLAEAIARLCAGEGG